MRNQLAQVVGDDGHAARVGLAHRDDVVDRVVLEGVQVRRRVLPQPDFLRRSVRRQGEPDRSLADLRRALAVLLRPRVHRSVRDVPASPQEGEDPACVHHCQAKCLEFGTIDELAEKLKDHPQAASVLLRLISSHVAPRRLRSIDSPASGRRFARAGSKDARVAPPSGRPASGHPPSVGPSWGDTALMASFRLPPPLLSLQCSHGNHHRISRT